jgi:thiol-disulfide isomerase/thioredoxin
MARLFFLSVFLLPLFLFSAWSFSPEFDNGQVIISATKEDGKPRTFDDLIAQFKGKVVYVDFWASWCGPCIMEMPNSEKLHEKLKGKDVVFLYISLDSDSKAWQRGLQRVKNKGYHFLPEKSVTAQIAKDFGINSIPRYMIVDKSGKVVVKDAPRPGDEKALYDLEKYISKK